MRLRQRAGLVTAAAVLLPLAAAVSAVAAPTSATAYAASCPTAGVVSQGYSSSHDGVDIANALGTPLYAVGAGEVIASGPASGYGQWIRILHDDGTVTEYGHLYQRDVAVGQYVQAPMSVSALTCTAGPTTPSS
ncbi:M23 family metallopeptidase [Streptomyces longwoodensis]|uniref:M23 family metallopeptidase n=1 Tax=Streptomyces longwoodensis TaxID=68231 RepID=UPI00384C764A